MYILVANERFGRVRQALAAMGHAAYSNDILPATDGGAHLLGDTRLFLGECQANNFKRWDMIIAFPPCTHLAVSGAMHFAGKRADGRQRAGIEFFCDIAAADCDKIAIENPVGIMSGTYITQWFPDLLPRLAAANLPRKPEQIYSPICSGMNSPRPPVCG